MLKCMRLMVIMRQCMKYCYGCELQEYLRVELERAHVKTCETWLTQE